MVSVAIDEESMVLQFVIAVVKNELTHSEVSLFSQMARTRTS